MKNKNLFFSLALLSALGGIGGTVVFATGARPMSFIPQAAMSDSIPQGMPSDSTVTDIPGVGNDSIPQGGGETTDSSDYTSVMSDPSFEADTTQYWGYPAYGVGTLEMGKWKLDYEVNSGSHINFSTRMTTMSPSDGTFYAEVWAGKLKSMDLHQVVAGLPMGRYRIQAKLRNIDDNVVDPENGSPMNYLSDQHVYAQIGDNVYDSPVMSEVSLGSTVENWEELATVDFLVVDEAEEVRIGVRSTNDGSDQTGWFQVDDFRIIRTGDATAEEVSAYLLEQVGQQYAEASQWLDTVAVAIKVEPYNTSIYTRIQSEVEALYSSVAGREDITAEEGRAVVDGIASLLDVAKAGEELVAFIGECEASLLTTPDDEFSAAVETAKVVAQAATGGTVEGYASALADLTSANVRYVVKYQNPADWDFSASASVGDYSLRVDNEHKVACIESYWGGEGSWDEVLNVEIPEKLVSSDGTEYTVVGLGNGYEVFGYGGIIKSVKLPYTLRFVGRSAFQGLAGLETVEMSQIVDSIGNNAFKNCTLLQRITLPSSLRTLGEYAFDGCSALAEVEFPTEVIEEMAVGNYAFRNCGLLQSVTLPSGLVSLGNYAFSGCTALSTVNFPDTLSGNLVLGEYAFQNCRNLRNLSLPSGLASIEDNAFAGCSALSEIALPSTLTNLGYRAFYNCSSLSSVSFSEQSMLSTIGDNAFNGTNLKEIVLPASLVSIGSNIFSSQYNEGGQYVSGLEKLTINAMTPPAVSYSLGADDIYAIHVPKGSGTAYRAAEVWKDYIIIEGDGVNLTIDVDTPGTLGEKVLAQTTDLVDVNYLTLTGSLNEDDIYNIQNRLVSLLEIDMAGVDMLGLGDGLFKEREALAKIILPENLEVIGSDVFNGCESLDSIVLPASLKTIGASAFRNCNRLKEVMVPEGVTEIGSNAFYGCSSLEKLSLPSTLSVVESYLAYDCSNLKTLILSEGIEEIDESAFYRASALAEVELPSTLTSLKSSAFGHCTALTRIVLPERLTECRTPFSNCSNLREVTSLSLLPPYLSNDYGPFGSNADMDGRTLYVPDMAVTDYKLTVGWDEFPTIQGISYLPQDIQVYKPYELDWNQPDSLVMNYKPDLTLTATKDSYGNNDEYGSLKVIGASTLSLGRFAMIYDPNEYYSHYTSTAYPSYNALVAEAPMRADSVRVTMYNRPNTWTFLSFPFDVKVSDIVSLFEGSSWVIRKYSGADRAAGNMAETWQNMTADSVLQAGVGYIWQSTEGQTPQKRGISSGNVECGFVVPAMDNANKNQIFANDTRSVALEEHLAEFSHNRSWNLVGNPFPCFYDIRFMGFTAPVTVWNERNNTYEAYSPVDDGFILRPGEAFFVQRPVDMAAIEFPTEGRQVDRTVREMPAAAGVNANGVAPAMRQVFNLTLTDGTLSDRTRFVLNENAKAGYDMATDAGKFMSPDASVPQLYTTEDGVDFSINERPMGNGLIALAARFGSEGMYTLSLDTDAGAAVYLVDKQTGTETDLRQGGYTFRAEAGTVADRFLVKVVDDGESDGSTTGVDGVEAQGVAVSVAQGRIQVVAPEASAISVYSVDGKAVGASVAAEASFEVRPGVYVVTVNGASRKVTVIE